MVAAASNDIYVAVASDKPNSICKTGIIVANEKSDNIVERILKKRFNITCHLYGGTKRFKREAL